MDPKKAGLQIALTGVGLEFVGWLGAALFPIESIRRGMPLMISFGLIAVFLGCVRIAKAKGHGWPVALLALLSFVGVALVWYVVPDKAPRS